MYFGIYLISKCGCFTIAVLGRLEKYSSYLQATYFSLLRLHVQVISSHILGRTSSCLVTCSLAPSPPAMKEQFFKKIVLACSP